MTYDAFLSYNSLDRPAVLRVAKDLENRGCRCFLDQWYLRPGRIWVEALERALAASRSAALFLGPHEMGRWQQKERAWVLDRQAETQEIRGRLALLSPREHEMFALLVEGFPTKLIAHRLGITLRTAEHHRAAVMHKMQARTISHLVRMALSFGPAVGSHGET